MFYEESPAACRRAAEALVEAAALPDDLPAALLGGLVPHAGWSYSGRLAAMTLRALLGGQNPPETVVLFGADHTGAVVQGELWPDGAWETPVGDVQIDEKLAGELQAACPAIRPNPAAHGMEHSIEVQLPLLHVLSPDTKIVPIAVPVDPIALEIGKAVGAHLAAEYSGQVCVIGSTDLTHHGGHFGNPGGRGPASEAYARENDSRIIELIKSLAAEAILPEAMEYRNACGAGAIAATLAAVREMGATAGKILEYTNSYEITHAQSPDYADDTTVGYLSAVFA